jgi:hypothetical protein
LFEQFDAVLSSRLVTSACRVKSPMLVRAGYWRNAGQAAAKRSGRTLDGQIQQWQTARMARCRQSIWQSRHAAADDGRRLREGLLEKESTASGVWGRHRLPIGGIRNVPDQFVCHVHHKKRSKDDAAGRQFESKIGARLEHVFAGQKENYRYRTSDDQDWNGQSRSSASSSCAIAIA